MKQDVSSSLVETKKTHNKTENSQPENNLSSQTTQ